MNMKRFYLFQEIPFLNLQQESKKKYVIMYLLIDFVSLHILQPNISHNDPFGERIKNMQMLNSYLLVQKFFFLFISV